MVDKDRRSMLNSVDNRYNRFEDDSGASAERRPLLKGLVVSLSSILGLGGTAAADTNGKGREMQKKTETAMDGFETPSEVNKAIDKYGGPLLTELAERGFLESTDSIESRTDGVNIQEAPTEVDPNEGTYVTASKHEEVFTAHISIVRKTEAQVVRINLQPQLGRSFATVKSRDGDLITVIDPSEKSTQATENSKDDVSIEKVCGSDGYTCPPGSCCTFCGTKQVKHERTCCQYSDGSVDCYEEPIDKCCEPLICC